MKNKLLVLASLLSITSISSAQPNNPCEGALDTLITNPNKIYVTIFQNQMQQVKDFQFEVRTSIDGPQLMLFEQAKENAIPVPGFSNCVSFGFNPSPSLARDGITRYYHRYRVIGTEPEFNSEWSPMSNPFVLFQKLSVGQIRNGH